VKGPWWFFQLWLNGYTAKVANMRPIVDCSIPTNSFAEAATPILRHCTSLGEVASFIPNFSLSASCLAHWFKFFYHGFTPVTVTWCVYNEALDFKIPFKFCFDDPLVDNISIAHFLTLISPCLLFVNIALN
jgi:hypothetical protein